MANRQEWEIWEAEVPYAEDNRKSSIRPVLIVSPTECLVLKITSHGHSEKPKPLEYEIAKWQQAGLTMQSYVQCDRFIRLAEDRFTGKQYGRLQSSDIIGIRYMMKFHGLIK